MMTRMNAVVAPRERISSGLTSVIRCDSGPKSVPSRRDKLLGLSPLSSSPNSSSLSEDLREEDIWGSDNENINNSNDMENTNSNTNIINSTNNSASNNNNNNSRRHWFADKEVGLSAAINKEQQQQQQQNPHQQQQQQQQPKARMIPQSALSNNASFEAVRHQSAPVNVPDWSKILGIRGRVDCPKSFELDSDEDQEEGEKQQQGIRTMKTRKKLAPHELVARDYSRSHATFSVYEGAGRTLKGRDLSRVRNAVWKQTGFLGG